jgi:valyl-tRNA synthetase
MISGWILDPDRKKMSKSKGNVSRRCTCSSSTPPTPCATGRRARGSARTPPSTRRCWKVGKRLVTKLFNAGKFVLAQPAPARPIDGELDRAFVARLRALAEECTRCFEAYEYAHALQETESFFWTHFTDTYLELVKLRARAWSESGGRDSAAESGSAVAALRLGLSVLLRLFAPVLPYITEEVWSWVFAAETGHASIHVAPWPGDADFAGVSAPADPQSFAVAVSALAAINKAKADAEVSMGREVLRIELAAEPDTLRRFEAVAADVWRAARCLGHVTRADAALEAGAFSAHGAEFAPKAAE